MICLIRREGCVGLFGRIIIIDFHPANKYNMDRLMGVHSSGQGNGKCDKLRSFQHGDTILLKLLYT